MPIITYIARQVFTYPFIVKVWEKATKQEAKQFWSWTSPKYSTNNSQSSTISLFIYKQLNTTEK